MDTASSVSWSNPASWLHLIREAFQEAGFTSYIALLAFVVIAAGLSRAQGVASERKQPWLPLVLTDIPLLIGVVGYLVAMSNVHDALVAVEPSMRAVLAERGQQEAMKNIYLGAGMTVLLTMQYVVMVLLKPRPSS